VKSGTGPRVVLRSAIRPQPSSPARLSGSSMTAALR